MSPAEQVSRRGHGVCPISAADLIETFPFPFTGDTYRYSTNVEAAHVLVRTPAGRWGDAVLAVDSEYEAELAERDRILAADPNRLVVLPHMRAAAWDALLTCLTELAQAYPRSMSLHREAGDPEQWTWRNATLGLTQTFRYGVDDSVPGGPLAFLGSQVQEDIVLLDQRDETLYGDAGIVTFAADWSFGFDVGMTFLEIHGPVPRIRETGVITRAHEFLKRLQPGEMYRRTNWTMTIGRRLDVSTELYYEWGPDRLTVQGVDDETFGRLVHLRVEVQHLIRLAESGAIMFLIRTYLLPLHDVAGTQAWRLRMASVLADLPDDMASYKGIVKYHRRAADWLLAHDLSPSGTTDR